MIEPLESNPLKPLRKLISKRWDIITERLGAIQSSASPDTIHELRINTRRLQELVELAGDVLPKLRTANTAKALRQARRVCGEVRNADVLTELLEAKLKGASDDDEIWGPLMARVSVQREEEIAALRQSLKRLDLPGLRDRWEKALKDWPKRDPKAEKKVRRDVAAHLKKREAQFRRAHGVAVNPEATIDEIHDMRLSGKRLRYALEVAADLGSDQAKAELARFKRFQEALGAWNDLNMMSELVLGFAARRRFLRENTATGIKMLQAVRRLQTAQEAKLKRSLTLVPAPLKEEEETEKKTEKKPKAA